jgi:hypothetical protein
MRTPRGEATEVRIEDVAAAEAAGYTPEVAAARVERLGEEAQAERYDTLGGQILAGTAGTLRGATLGGSDVVASLLGSEGDVEALREVRKYNPGISLGTEILGGVAPSLLTGGTGTLGAASRLTPSGALSAGSAALGEAVGAGGGVARQIAGTALGAATEGAVQNVGSYVSDVALEDKKLSAEGFLASAGQGALWGGAAGGALGGIERGTIAARRLFPKSVAKDREAVQVIEDRFLASANDAITAGDDLEKAARSAVDDLRLRSAELNLEREKIRGSKDAADRIRMREIDVEKARIAAARKALRDQKNAERAAAGLPDIPPEVAAPSPPPLDEASVVPTGPPANDVAPLAPANDLGPPLTPEPGSLEAQLLGTQQMLDRGVAFRDIPGQAETDLAIAAQNTAHEAGMLADDAAQGGADAAERLSQKTEDYAARKQAVKDWISKYQPGARNRFSSSMTGEDLAGGAPRRTDRTRILPDGGVDFEAQAGDRVFAGIGEARDRAALPRGFDYGPPGPEAPVRRGLPAFGDQFDENTIYVAKAGDFKRAGLRAGDDSGFAQNRVDSVKKAWSDKKRLDPIKAGFEENGDLVIIDGRHRLAAAGDDDEIAVRLYPFSDEPGQAMGRSGPAERYAAATVASAPPPTRGADLDSAYDDIIERASNAADRAESTALAKEAGAIEEEILERVASRGGDDAEQVAKIRAKRAEYNWTAEDVAARRAEKLAIAKSNEPVTPSAKMRAEQRDLDAYERVVRANQGRADMAHSYPGEKAKTLGEEILAKGGESATAAPSGHPRDMGRFIADADEAIRVVGDFERAQYELAKEMGPAAPPAIARHADQYAAALDDQARKTTEAIAGKADDAIKNGNMPNPAALVSLPKAPAVAAGDAKKAAGRIADVAGMLELINSAGDIPFLPDPKNLPVIGPILGLYLKYRGMKAVYHRLGGRIGATAEAKVAARSAEIRDRAADIADTLLEGASKAAKKGRSPVVIGGSKLTDVLKHSLFPGADRKDEKTAQDAAKARIEELSRAVADPESVRAAVREKVGAADPDLANAIADATLVKLQYLQKHAPKQPPPSMFGQRPWKLSTGEIERFARRVRAADDPLTVLQDVERGTVTAEAAETLREVYPALFSEVQTRLLSRAAELEAKLPYQRVISLSLLFDAPLDDSLRPQNLLVLQQAHASSAAQGPSPAAPGQPPQPSVAGPVNLSRLYETSEIRRASRR